MYCISVSWSGQCLVLPFFFVENMQFKIMQNSKRDKLNYPVQGFIYIVRL